MGQLIQWLKSAAADLVGAIKRLLGGRSSKADQPPTKKIPGPDERFVFTRHDAMDDVSAQ